MIKIRSSFFVTGLFSIFFMLALSGAPAEAISNVSVTVPGSYYYEVTNACADGKTALNVNVHLTGTTDDGGYDEFALIAYDGSSNVIDVEFDGTTPGLTTTLPEVILPGLVNFSNPVSRPFTVVVYDIPYYNPTFPYTLADANWILANGTKMASTTFDPSFDPPCAKLPLNVTAIPALSIEGLALLGLLLAAGALALMRRS